MRDWHSVVRLHSVKPCILENDEVGEITQPVDRIRCLTVSIIADHVNSRSKVPFRRAFHNPDLVLIEMILVSRADHPAVVLDMDCFSRSDI
jgi:hypothetical protein